MQHALLLVVILLVSLTSAFAPGSLEHLRSLSRPLTAPKKQQQQQQPSGVRILPKLSEEIKRQATTNYISFGRTHCNSTGNPQNFYTNLNDQAYRTFFYYVNQVLGGVTLNGTRYMLRDVNYNDGADCVLMQIVYQHMIDVDGVQFLFAPTNPDCSVLAKLAETRKILYLDGADYSMVLLQLTPNSTTKFDTGIYASIPYANLQWTINFMNNQITYGVACSEAMTNVSYVDQSRTPAGQPPTKVRTFVAAYNQEVPYLVPQHRTALLARNCTELYPMQVWNLQDIVTQQCAYLQPTLDQWRKLDPDLILVTSGASNTSLFFTCLDRMLWRPKLAILPPVPVTDPTYPAWHTEGILSPTNFDASENFADPVFGNFTTWNSTYTQLFGFPPSSYELTIVATAIVTLDCIVRTQSIDSVIVRACILAYNYSTAYGQVQISNGADGSRYVDRPLLCVQNVNGTSNVIYPLDWPGFKQVLLPDTLFAYPQSWFDLLAGTPWWTQIDTVLVVCLSIFGVLVVIGLIIVVIVRTKYHAIFIPKTEDTDEWA